MTSENNDLMPACLDRQISIADHDAFGHRHFAEALRSLIESKTHSPPFSIGLLGGWGTGKSTIKDLYIGALHNDSRKDSSRRTRSDRIHTITFNAWRFGGREQDIKRALLRHVYLELGGDEDNLQDRLFRQITESRNEEKGWCRYTLEVLKA
jgi:predicted KAP-like P-loop ATPase